MTSHLSIEGSQGIQDWLNIVTNDFITKGQKLIFPNHHMVVDSSVDKSKCSALPAGNQTTFS
jgi:hypothetical protein